MPPFWGGIFIYSTLSHGLFSCPLPYFVTPGKSKKVRFMALENLKISDLWRWRTQKVPIYGVGKPKKFRFMALEVKNKHSAGL